LQPRDLAADRVHVGAVGAVALALAPESQVLLAQVAHGRVHPAVQAEAVADLGAVDLPGAPPAVDQDAAHAAPPSPIQRTSSSGPAGRPPAGAVPGMSCPLPRGVRPPRAGSPPTASRRP